MWMLVGLALVISWLGEPFFALHDLVPLVWITGAGHAGWFLVLGRAWRGSGKCPVFTLLWGYLPFVAISTCGVVAAGVREGTLPGCLVIAFGLVLDVAYLCLRQHGRGLNACVRQVRQSLEDQT